MAPKQEGLITLQIKWVKVSLAFAVLAVGTLSVQECGNLSKKCALREIY